MPPLAVLGRHLLRSRGVPINVLGVGAGSGGMAPVFDGASQRVFFVARLRGGVNRSAIAAIADGTRR